MRRRVLAWMAGGAFLFQGGVAAAQDSLKALEDDLKMAQQEQKEATAQALAGFFGQIDPAMNSPDAAVALYRKAGGVMPEPTPVVTVHEHESETEKETREAQDQTNLAALGAVLQVHCGLMHYAALLIVKPDQKGLQDEWVAWLQKMALVYPQLGVVPAADSDLSPEQLKKKMAAAAGRPPPPPPFNVADSVKGKAMRDSLISKLLDFKYWGDKEQGGWSIRDLPKLYRADILEPLRASPTPATLAAWDAYIGMMNADEKDNGKWNEVVYPPLHFDRACDDYAVAPSTEKLEALVALIKANPTYPQVGDWIARAGQLINDYRARHGGTATAAPNSAAAPAPSAPAGNPNVIVTTTQQGDATIITTHTNSAPVTNAPPPH